MKKSGLLCLFLMTLISCETVRFKPPRVERRLVSVEFNEDGSVHDVACVVTPADPGLPVKILPIEFCDKTIGVGPDDYEKLDTYYYDKIRRLEICLNSPKKCR